MKKLMAIAAALLAMQAGSANATEIKPFVGVGVGVFELDPGQNKQTTIGGYGVVGAKLHQYFSAEFRAGLTGPHEREEVGPLTETFKVDWFVSLLAKPQIEVVENVELYGLLGATSISTSITPLNSVVQTTVTNTALTFGLGGSYQLNDKLRFGAEWVRYSTKADVATKNTVNFKGLDVNGFTATVAYNF